MLERSGNLAEADERRWSKILFFPAGNYQQKRVKFAYRMLVFIDDSGDPGFKLQKGSSSVFVIAMVIFDDSLIVEETALALKKLRRELKFPDTVEFKFHKSRKEIKRKFLQACANYNFRIRAIVVRKENRIFRPEICRLKTKYFNSACGYGGRLHSFVL